MSQTRIHCPRCGFPLVYCSCKTFVAMPHEPASSTWNKAIPWVDPGPCEWIEFSRIPDRKSYTKPKDGK